MQHLKQHPDENLLQTGKGAYHIQCDECEAFYIGVTGRKLINRVEEHRKVKHRSTFGRHLLCTSHKTSDYNNIKLLHNQNKGPKLCLLEAYEIWKCRENENLLNKQEELK